MSGKWNLHKAGVTFKDIGVWMGIKCVTTSLRQARPLCRDSRHTNRGGLKDQKGRCPASELVISGHKAIKQKLLSKPSFDSSFFDKTHAFKRLVLFCNLPHTREAWRKETFNIILTNSTPLHIYKCLNTDSSFRDSSRELNAVSSCIK